MAQFICHGCKKGYKSADNGHMMANNWFCSDCWGGNGTGAEEKKDGKEIEPGACIRSEVLTGSVLKVFSCAF